MNNIKSDIPIYKKNNKNIDKIFILYNKKSKSLLIENEREVMSKLYFLEDVLPSVQNIKDSLNNKKNDKINKLLELLGGSSYKIVDSLKKNISKIEDYVPLYDSYSENIYLIGQMNVYDRVIHYSYRFPEQELIDNLYVSKRKLEKNNLDDPLMIRKLRKIELMIEFLSFFDINVLYDTYIRVFYKYSEFAGKEITLCKRNSFLPLFQHLRPYYSKSEIYNTILNLGIKPDKDIKELCNIMIDNEISSSILIDHQKHIITNNYLGFVQYYTLQGSFFMNQYLRMQNNYKYANKYLEGLIAPMWLLILKAPKFDKPYIFYRFINNDSYLKHLKIGNEYKEEGFMSTTRDPYYRSDLYEFGFILVKVRIPANIAGIAMCLELVSHFPEEQEIIFPPNTTFKLIKKDEAVEYYHTDQNISSKVKIRYEFEWVKHEKPSFNRDTIYTGTTEVINFLNINKIDTFSLEEKIKYFISKYVNPMYQLKITVGDIELTCVIERYDSTSAYKKFYALTSKNGVSIYTIYRGYVLFFIEMGEIETGREMHINYYVKYSALDTEKIMGDVNFVKFVSSIAHYFDVPNVVMYANYLTCDYKQQKNNHTTIIKKNQSGGDILQRGFADSEKNSIYAKSKFAVYGDTTNIYYGGSFCSDLYQYLSKGIKRYEDVNILKVELRPKFSYHDLDALKNINTETILNKEDRDECYQLYHKTYKIDSNKYNITDFYIWLKEHKCYLLDDFVRKITRIMGTNNPFLNDMYILDPVTFLYNRNIIKNYPIYTNMNIDPKKYLLESDKNKYRLEKIITPKINI